MRMTTRSVEEARPDDPLAAGGRRRHSRQRKQVQVGPRSTKEVAGRVDLLNPPATITTPRLILRFPDLAAPDTFAAYATDPEVTRHLQCQQHQDLEETRTFLRGRIQANEDGEDLYWSVRLRSDDGLSGAVALGLRDFKAHLGYVIARRHWRQGYCTEAVQAVVDWARRQPEIWRVWAVCDLENAASARVMEKVGMEREGILRRWIEHPNVSANPRDCLCYSWVREAG